MAGKKKKPQVSSNARRFDPYKNFKFLVRKAAGGARTLITRMKSALDAAFLRRLR
jgi:hypothetical protein